jgi:hypothetical protein
VATATQLTGSYLLGKLAIPSDDHSSFANLQQGYSRHPSLAIFWRKDELNM